MQIGIDSVGVFEGDLPENVVVMQIGVSSFCRKTGALCRIGWVVPRSAKNRMCKKLAIALDYVATTLEEVVYPAPERAVRKLAPVARAVAMIAVFVVTRVARLVESGARVLARGAGRFARGFAIWVDEEFLAQPGLLWGLVFLVGGAYWFVR